MTTLLQRLFYVAATLRQRIEGFSTSWERRRRSQRFSTSWERRCNVATFYDQYETSQRRRVPGGSRQNSPKLARKGHISKKNRLRRGAFELSQEKLS